MTLALAGITATSIGAGPFSVGAAAATPVAGKSLASITERPDAFSAAMAARKQHHRVEVTNDRTETSTTYANADGTFTMEQSEQPVRVKTATGWVPVDTKLAANPDGSVSPVAHPGGLRLSGGSTQDNEQTLVTLGDGSSAVTLSWHGKLAKPTLSGSTATYPNALPGVDLKIQATRTGFETFLVLRARPDNSLSFTLPLRAHGLTAGVNKAGGVDFHDAKGKVVGSMPAPTMWDSAVDPHTGQPSHTAPVALSTTTKDGVVYLTYTADRSFLATASYPVTVDPATSLGRNHWLLASAYEPSRTYFDSDNNADVGTPDGGTHAYRSFFSFDPSAVWGKHVLSATLNTNETHSWTCTASPVELWDTGSFTSASNWSNQPAWNSKLGTQTVANGYSSSCPAANVAWDVTGEVQGWAATNAAVGTMALRATSETDSTQWKWFDNNPSVSVTYNSYPGSPAAQAVSPSVTTGGTLYSNTPTPTLSATDTDADGGSLTYSFQVLSGSTVVATGTASGVSSGGTASWTTPSLANGAYTWQVRANDGTDNGSWSAAQAFTVNANIDAAPTVSSTAYPAGAWTAQASGGGSFTFADTSSDVTGYVYGLDQNPPSAFTTGSSVTLNPGPGLHTLYVQAQNSSGNRSGITSYTFGVGSSGIAEPADGSTGSSTFNLKAAAPSGATGVTFQYRVGTSGSYTTIPAGDVTNAGTALTGWPVATTAVTGGTSSPELVWKASKTLAGDGPLQIQAVFAGGSTTPAVTVTLQRNGVGSDFASTSLGPVSVGLQSGNASLAATDVSVASYRAGLGVSRTFNSLAPATPSIFGPGWTASLPVLGTSASWSALVDGGSYAQLTAADGSVRTFLAGSTAGGVTAYNGQGTTATSGLVLTKSSTGFHLVDAAGTKVDFAVPDASKPSVYAPSLVTQPGTNRSTGYTYAGGKLVLITAPDPAAADNAATTAACAYPVAASSWAAGCRGLALSYDSATGNLAEVDFVAVDNTNGFQKIPVADYAYDGNGRLTAEWDPRISPALKNQYGYDGSGRLASVTPAQDPATGNLKPWTFSYDNTAGDVDYGKLLNVTRAHGDGTSAVQSVLYHVPVTKAAGGPLDLDAATVATWGQSDVPVSVVAEFPADHQPGSTPDYTWATLHYYDAAGNETNTASYGNGWHVTTTEYDTNGNVVRNLTAANREAALASGPSATAPTYVGRSGSKTGTGTGLTSVTVPVTAAVKAGDALVLSTMLTNSVSNSVAGNVTATDSQGDTFQVVSDVNDGSAKDRTLMLAAFGVHALSTSDTVTLHFPSTSEYHVAVDEIAGASGLDVSSSATGASGTNVNTGNTPTTATANELVFGTSGIQGGAATSWTGGFTALPTLLVSGDQLGTAYKTTSATGAYAATATATHSWLAAVATFRSGVNSAAIARQLDTENVYSADGTELLDSYGPMRSVSVAGYSTPQQARTHTHNAYDEGAPGGGKDANGTPFRLVTTKTESAGLGAAVPAATDTDTRTTKNVYTIGSDASGWTLRSPLQTVTDPSGLGITRTTRYNTDTGLYGGEPLAVSASLPTDTAGTGAGTTNTVYYTAGANTADAACGNQPNWANLVCKVSPAAQPGSTGLPALRVTQYTYNLYLQPLTKTETSGSVVRTTQTGYDAAGRQARVSVRTTGDSSVALPDQVTVYSPATGQVTDLQTVDAGNNVIADTKAGYDEWGQGTSYTDADGVVSATGYDVAGRIVTRSDGKGTTTLTYNGGNERRGLPTGENDTQAGTFSGSYNADGQLTGEVYPDATTGTHSYDATGQAVQLGYGNANWSGSLVDSVVPTVHGNWATRATLNSTQTFGYDAADRLAGVADTQANQCTTRNYTYDANSNRTSVKTAAPTGTGACQTATATTVTNSYDGADRLTNTGYAYDALGRTTTTPSADAANTGDVTATYFSTDLTASQTQGSDLRTFTLDPQLNRFRTTADSVSGVTTTNHYTDGSDSPSWTGDSSGGWTRYVPGIDGQLAGSFASAGNTLYLTNLHGDVMATTAPTGAAAPTASFTYGEFGAVETGTPGRYGWLGGAQRSASGLGGTLLMGVRNYNPNTGRFQQTDPVTGGSANAYDYGDQNPLTNADTTGAWCYTIQAYASFCGGGGGISVGMSRQQMINILAKGAGAIYTQACNYFTDGLARPICSYAGKLMASAVQRAIPRGWLPRTIWVNFRYGVAWHYWIPQPYFYYASTNVYW
ncbi:RHS repeat-associated core domain-containing protein [Kitasatospora sp. McL0602]|uniref:RHS repeat-associated core domain-containing protein n=1 Tax=Kitasatospora sp. McL0602 TaxID=3439530 RepID=UPI003F886A67